MPRRYYTVDKAINAHSIIQYFIEINVFGPLVFWHFLKFINAKFNFE